MFAKFFIASCLVAATLARPDKPVFSSGGYQAPQPPQQSYSQPQRSFAQPQQSYSQPQPSYSQPQPSYSQPEQSYEKEEGMPFNYGYEVKDEYSGNEFSHKSDSDGHVEKGEYRVLLPDGRTQIVTYVADWEDGYKAEVTYEGEAKYDEPQRSYSNPQPSYEQREQPKQTYQQPQQTYQQPKQPQQTYQQPQQTYQQPQQTYQQPRNSYN